MTRISQRVGLSFIEAMSGTLLTGETDPDKAAAQAAGRPANFKFSLLVDIDSLDRFLSAPSKVARFTRGSVRWDGVCSPNTPILTGGTIQMYRHLTPDGRKKDFRFTFSFRGDDGAFYTLDGQKRLENDEKLDIFDDLSRVFARIQRDGKTVAAGLLSVHFAELVDQLLSMQVNDAENLGDQIAAKQAFFTFMNAELAQVYPGLPALFQHDDRRFLRPSEWRALTFIAQAMLPDPLPPNGPSLEDTVLNLQSFVRNATGSALDEIRGLLRALGLVTPFLSPAHTREALRKLVAKGDPKVLDVIDQLKLVAAVPYYAHPKADRLVGYKRPTFEPPKRTRLATAAAPSTTQTYDVVIVGAGVAGSLIAQRATAKGKSVLLLDAGVYQPEHEVSSDEVRMTARLYKRSGLQTTNQALTILQAWCVGGGGLINNAICFQLPDARLKCWQNLGFPVESASMRAAYAAVAAELGIKPASQAAKRLNPALRFLRSLGDPVVPRVDQPPPAGLSECLVNLEQCDGLGLCNTGCGNERKRNAYQVHLPQALATGLCTLVPEARVVHIALGADRAVSGVTVDVRGQRMVVQGKSYVLAAGAISSSGLLLASDVSARLPELPIGQRFSANVGSPAFVFSKPDQLLHPQPSLQISHAYLPEPDDGIIIESWFAPPGTVALALPGYFDKHAERMRRYAYCTVLAPLVGLAARGRIRVASGRATIDLPIEKDDLDRLVKGAITIARAAMTSAGAGFDHAVLGTRTGHEVRSEADIEAFKKAITSPSQLRLGSGHPQGGNAMSTDPAIGVVDETFLVRGTKNLRVCDASVFPDVASVNPQWTVLALAHLCAEHV
jgi:choline dehydrogenase-like flavoprotein